MLLILLVRSKGVNSLLVATPARASNGGPSSHLDSFRASRSSIVRGNMVLTTTTLPILLLGFAGAIGSVVGWMPWNSPSLKVETGTEVDGAQIGSASTPVLSFKSGNDYPPVDWSPWKHLAEPYKETALKAKSTVGDPERDLFVWILEDENGAMYEGRWATPDGEMLFNSNHGALSLVFGKSSILTVSYTPYLSVVCSTSTVSLGCTSVL